MKFYIFSFILIIGYISAIKVPINTQTNGIVQPVPVPSTTQANRVVQTIPNNKPVQNTLPVNRNNSYILQLAAKGKNPNDLFNDVTSSEDKYDPLSIPEPHIVDYNHVYDTDTDIKEIENIIRQDLRGEQVSYQFD
jgi:hypothetical protein